MPDNGFFIAGTQTTADDVAAAMSDAEASKLKGRPANAKRLLDALQDIEFYKSVGSNDCYADIVESNIRRTLNVRQTAFREWLALKSMDINDGKIMSRSTLDSVIDTCAARAAKVEPREVFLRFAAHGKDAWIDIGDDTWRAIHVTPTGWDIKQSTAVPVRFQRSAGMMPLPMPARTTDPAQSLSQLLKVMHIGTDDLLLLAAALCMAMSGRGPLAVMVFDGPPGAAKTSAMRFSRMLVDPTAVPYGRKSDSSEDMMIRAENNAILCIDNLSSLDADLSDTLCGIATGQGQEARKLYSDKEMSSLFVRRLVMLTGVGGFITRGDLLDRSLILNVAAIEESERKKEEEVEQAFNLIHSEVLGALLEGVVRGLAGVPRPTQLPRMADFYHWCMGAAEAFAPASMLAAGAVIWSVSRPYEDAFRRKRSEAHKQFVSDDPVAAAVLSMFDATGLSVMPCVPTERAQVQLGTARVGTLDGTATFDTSARLIRWEGKAQALLNTLRQVVSGGMHVSGFPQTPRSMSVAVTHSMGSLLTMGVTVRKRTNTDGHTVLILTR